MQYNLKGTEVSITSEVRNYLDKKLSGFDRLLRDSAAARIDAEMHFMRNEEKKYRAEFKFITPELNDPLRAEAHGKTLHEAIDIATGDLFTELTRARGKRQHFMRRGAERLKQFVRKWRE